MSNKFESEVPPAEHTPQSHPYEKLSPDLVMDAVEANGYLTDARILALNSYENRVYQVGIEDSRRSLQNFIALTAGRASKF